MLFFVQKKQSPLWKFIPIVLLAACTVLFGVFSSKLSDDNTKRSKSTLERALTRSITQCYALQETNTPEINYLTDNYGLTYDSDYYYIDYRDIGSNQRPDVTIIERK